MTESEIGHDEATRSLTIVGGSRRDADVTAAGGAILDLLGEEQGRSGRAIEEALLPTHKKRSIRDGIKFLVTTDAVKVRSGPRGAVLHYLADESSAPVRRTAPAVRRRSPDECASAPIGAHSSALARSVQCAEDESVA